ncbi:MAG: hypothetical protein LBH06_06440 [Rikenellaceae bacterium]|jgi:hypothetical protein|nr:hypothetical protein [Rikenellaceae bacterium]
MTNIKEACQRYSEFVYKNLKNNIPVFIETPDKFLQFLYDINIIGYKEEAEQQPFHRWCYRERSLTNMSPKIRTNSLYRIHYGLAKALNVGNRNLK